MVRALKIQFLVVVMTVLTAAALSACGGADESWRDSSASETVVVEKEVVRTVEVPGRNGSG